MTVRLWAATKIVLICLLVAMMGIVIIPAYFLRAEGLRTGAIRTMLRGINLILRVRVQVQGEASTHTPVIYVANHISYLDIPVLGCLLGASFTPKAELASWPVLGWLARLNRPVFIDRRAAAAERDRDAIAQRIDLVGKVIIFPEATTGLGRDVLRFRSSFFSLAEGRSEEQPIDVQPITL
ncbi:MAG: 1-acyl-sn-glycerol-3-phosphate acyltransferase, partial [Chlamydiia bacterium]|nr:1-acyl-sn-glycerol-3-phosphate acyltransferase [Chlamydiia bacterium]